MPRKPSQGQLVYPFGVRTDPINGSRRMHNGQDLAHDKGTLLVAPERVQLVSYGTVGDWGRLAVLRAGTRDHRLAHTSQLAPGVRVGDWLDEGEPVAIMGETGRAVGVHLHWEVTENGHYIDPAAWLARYAGRPAGTAGNTTAGPAGTSKGDTMIVFIKGRAGRRIGGLYHLSGGRATLLQATGRAGGFPVLSDEAAIAKLAGLYAGDL